MPSVMQRIGTPNARHNIDNKYRAHLDHIDSSLSKYNEVIRAKSVEEIYQEYLQPGFDEFNAKQKRRDRRLDVKWGCDTYLEYQRKLDKAARESKNNIDKKGKPPIREIVWQFGNPEQGYGCADQTDESRQKIKEMLLEAQAEAEQRYPNLAWGDCVFHADEVSLDADDVEHGSIHLHVSFVPLCFDNKQGTSVQVAFERSLREMGFETFEEWKHDLDQIMEEVLERHGLSREYVDNHEKHVNYGEYHRQQKVIRQTRELEERLSDIRREVDIAGIELEGRLTEFVDDVVDEVTDIVADEYSDIMFLISECSEERFEELAAEGKVLKRERLAEEAAEESMNLQEKILRADLTAGRQLTWEERQALWQDYKAMSDVFWEERKRMKEDNEFYLRYYSVEKYLARKSYYEAKDWLRSSRNLLEYVVAAIYYCATKARKEAAEEKFNLFKEERNELIRATSSFAKYSKSVRESLKQGKMPYEKSYDTMAEIVTMLDEEYENFYGKDYAERKEAKEKMLQPGRATKPVDPTDPDNR